MKELFVKALQSLQAGRAVVLCSVVASSGSTPRGAGAKMLVWADGKSFGTIGGGMVEHVSTELAKEVHASGRSYGKDFRLRPNEVADLGMVCGGDVTVYFQYIAADAENIDMLAHIVALLNGDGDAWLITILGGGAMWSMGTYDDVNGLRYLKDVKADAIKPLLRGTAVLTKGEPQLYVEPIARRSTVYVFGGGHVSQELVPVLGHVGFRAVVFEDRADFADMALFPGAKGTVLGDFTNIGEKVHIAPQDYIVIMTRGHQADYEVLEQALRTDATYIGMIGSRTKMAATRKRLLAAGVPEEALKRIHNPIGTPIKAETPAEIAISIAGELILHRASLS